jgi:hypothetical protein
MTEVKLDRKAQEYAPPESVAVWSNISPPLVDLNAQIKMAIHATGTMVLFAMNNHRKLFGCMHKNGTLISQKMRKLIMVFVSMP